MMNSVGTYDKVFKATLIAETETEGLTVQVYDNDIVYIRVHQHKSITRAGFESSKDFLRRIGVHKKYRAIFEFENYSDVDPDMRKERAKSTGSEFALSDAMVISTLSHKILVDFYMRIHKPTRPTKVFFSLEKAIQWSLKQGDSQDKK